MKWSKQLTKKSVSEFLFNPVGSFTAEDSAQLTELRKLCHGELNSREAVQQIKLKLKEFTKGQKISLQIRTVINDIHDELSEILDDLRFAGSAKGSFVLFCNDYGQNLYTLIRPNPQFSDVYIGANAKAEEIIITGQVANKKVLQELQAIIAEHPPGVKVQWAVTVRKAGSN